MPYTSVMVYVDTGDSNAARIRLACDLAMAFDARLIGISVSAPCLPTMPPMRSIAPVTSDIDLYLDHAEADLRCAESIFFHGVKAQGRHTEWRSSIDDPNDFVASQARAADILIVGRMNNDVWSHHAIDPADLVRRAGRPVLVVPTSTAVSPLASPAVIAWKDCGEARRAVQDALPLLLKSSSVSVIDIAEEAREATALREASDVASFLRRHGVKSEAVMIKDDGRSVSTQIMKFAGMARAGLIVMGARSHARLHDWMIGGETHDMLKACSTCLLLSN